MVASENGEKMKKMKWTDSERTLMVLEIMRGKRTAGQIAKERGISDSVVYKWRDQALKAIGNQQFPLDHNINIFSEL